MTTRYKIDGAKFTDMDTLRKSLWPLYKNTMTEEEFEKYITENVKEVETE